MGATRGEHSPTIAAQLLYRLHGRGRTPRQDLGHTVESVMNRNRTSKGLNGTLAGKDQSRYAGDRQQDIEAPAHQVYPEIPDRARTASSQTADKGDGDRHAHRRAGELGHHDCTGLREVRERRFTGVGLPTGVEYKRDCRVKGKCRGNARQVLGVHPEVALQPENGVGE